MRRPKPPLCKGRWAAVRLLGGVDFVGRRTIPQSASLTAPFTQGSLCLQHRFTLQIIIYRAVDVGTPLPGCPVVLRQNHIAVRQSLLPCRLLHHSGDGFQLCFAKEAGCPFGDLCFEVGRFCFVPAVFMAAAQNQIPVLPAVAVIG